MDRAGHIPEKLQGLVKYGLSSRDSAETLPREKFRYPVLAPLNMTKVRRTSTHNTGARRNVASIEASVRVSQIGHYVLLVKTWDSSAINAYPCSDCDMGSEWSPIIYRKGEHSLRDRDPCSDRLVRFFEGSLILAYRSCPEIAWIPLRDGAGHCSCSAEGMIVVASIIHPQGAGSQFVQQSLWVPAHIFEYVGWMTILLGLVGWYSHFSAS